MNYYLSKHKFCERQLAEVIAEKTGIIVVIPCYNEPDLLITLESLWKCHRAKCISEIIVVINSGENDTTEVLKQNEKTKSEFIEWKKNHDDNYLKFFLIDIKNLPHRHAGVGLARKTGMDEAVWRFDEIKNEQGIIVCLDADCTVSKNYLSEIENHFAKNLKATGCSIYFEHAIDGNSFSKEVYSGIINYELFLRYYKLSLAFCGFPFPFHTVGSSMAVRNYVYQKQGGMNRRKAGEDFYFLHKIFPLSNFSELKSACVYPSPRQSNRVPFGTGSAINKFIAAGTDEYLTYNFQTFCDLKLFFEKIPYFFSSSPCSLITSAFPLSITTFLHQNHFEEKLKEIKENCSSQKQFVNRFFRWFDGFMVLKLVHFIRDNYYRSVPVASAAAKLIKEISGKIYSSKTEMLYMMRKIERKG